MLTVYRICLLVLISVVHHELVCFLHCGRKKKRHFVLYYNSDFCTFCTFLETTQVVAIVTCRVFRFAVYVPDALFPQSLALTSALCVCGSCRKKPHRDSLKTTASADWYYTPAFIWFIIRLCQICSVRHCSVASVLVLTLLWSVFVLKTVVWCENQCCRQDFVWTGTKLYSVKQAHFTCINSLQIFLTAHHHKETNCLIKLTGKSAILRFLHGKIIKLKFSDKCGCGSTSGLIFIILALL